MSNNDRIFSQSFQEMTWNGPIVFMHWYASEDQQLVDQITPNIFRIFGYKPEELTSGKVPLLTIIFEEDRDMFRKVMKERIAERSPFWESSYRIYGKSGNVHFIKTYTYIKFEKQSNRVSVFSYIFDQTDLRQEIDMHMLLEQRWSTAIDSAREGVWDWNMKDNTIFYSKHWKGMLGYQEHELPNELEEWQKRIHPADLDKIDNFIEKHVNNESDYHEVEHRIRHKDGSYRWILNRGKAVERDKSGRATRLIGTHVDITKSKLTEDLLLIRNQELEQLLAQIKEISITDPLTTLYNRRKMVEEIEQAQIHYLQLKNTFTLAILDLDYFKQINDRFGHSLGDVALKAFSKLLKNNVRVGDIVARWGGEEFIILFPQTKSSDALQILERLQELCANDLLLLNNEAVTLSFSAGVCEYNDARILDDLIKFADHALYEAKSEGRNQIILYVEELLR